MKNKLPAYTLIEIMVVLALSTLVFSTFLLVIQIIQQQQAQQSKDYAEVLEFNQIQALLQQDAFEANALLLEEKQLFCTYDNYEIIYDFKPKYVLRKIIETNIHTDTFWRPTIALSATWQNQVRSVGWIDQLDWQSQFFEQTINIQIQKKYDSKTRLEQGNYGDTAPY